IPSSNFVRNSVDLQDQYSYFSQTKSQFLVFGLGSQVRPNEKVVLEPGTEKFLRLAAERSGSLGVRGARTAELLLSLGIRNLDITGCPSLLNFPSELKRNRIGHRRISSRIATNYSSNVRSHSFAPLLLKKIESRIFSQLIGDNTFYIV